jgi:hypothetical protein
MDNVSIATKIMTEFARSTGLSTPGVPARRYLWTDAFAVCNFLELHVRTGNKEWLQRALDLVDQVHHVLGRHREDDARTGWISQLTDEEGERHPTRGGLRIGKPMNERGENDAFDEQEEWNRDGQYYHYLTKWMHALDRVALFTGEAVYNLWAVELARAAHAAFVHPVQPGMKRMHWKMSIDLSTPLVASMGLHDPLDGLLTYTQLQETARQFSESGEPCLDSEIADMEKICQGKSWTTDDPLGLGGLLTDAYRIMQLKRKHGSAQTDLLMDVLSSSAAGLNALASDDRIWKLPADYRLPFRELGLAIGLHAVERMWQTITQHPDSLPEFEQVRMHIDQLGGYICLSERIESFWLEPAHNEVRTWTEHLDINSVMLATSLAPDAYLELSRG